MNATRTATHIMEHGFCIDCGETAEWLNDHGHSMMNSADVQRDINGVILNADASARMIIQRGNGKARYRIFALYPETGEVMLVQRGSIATPEDVARQSLAGLTNYLVKADTLRVVGGVY